MFQYSFFSADRWSRAEENENVETENIVFFRICNKINIEISRTNNIEQIIIANPSFDEAIDSIRLMAGQNTLFSSRSPSTVQSSH